MHRTLRHFLSVSLDPDAGKPALVRAVEMDPAILVSLLGTGHSSAANLSNWHETIGESMLQAVAISTSSAAVVHPFPTEVDEQVWRDSLLHSLLGDALAQRVDKANAAESRLAGLLSCIGAWLEPSGDPARADAAAADFLESLGCSRSVCDAIRYRREGMDQLRGTSVLLRLNAVAARLVQYIGGPQLVPSEQLWTFWTLIGLGEEDIYDVIGRASRAYELTTASLAAPCTGEPGERPSDSLTDLVTSASVGAVFYRALVKSVREMPLSGLVEQAGRFLFGFAGVCHFRPRDEALAATMDDGLDLHIDRERPESNIARSYRNHQLSIVTRLRVTDLIERQLLGRFESQHLLCLPVGDAGMLVCGIDQLFAENIDHHKVLLTGYADAIGDLYAAQPGEAGEVISLEELNRRVREITHEVNNPLAIVQNYLRTLSLKLGDSPPVQNEIDAISREIIRVGSIVQKYARIGREEELVLRRVDLNRMIEELLGIVKGGKGDLTVETRLDPSIPVMELAGDALRQVILNLLKNAAEALDGVAGARIDVATQGAVNVDGKHYLEIVITDNGPGMSQEQRLKLFTEDASVKGEGRGLGLGIVKQLLGQMSGSISCRENISVSGSGGTSFQILLPLEQNDTNGSRA